MHYLCYVYLLCDLTVPLNFYTENTNMYSLAQLQIKNLSLCWHILHIQTCSLDAGQLTQKPTHPKTNSAKCFTNSPNSFGQLTQKFWTTHPFLVNLPIVIFNALINSDKSFSNNFVRSVSIFESTRTYEIRQFDFLHVKYKPIYKMPHFRVIVLKCINYSLQDRRSTPRAVP